MLNPRPRPKRILGIDYGLSRIGLSLSDERKIIASSLTTFQAEKKAEQTVIKLVQFLKDHQDKEGYDLEEIVIGYPLMMSGKTGFLADEVKHFTSLLEQVLPVPIKLWDERLSTVQAERSLKESFLTRKQRSKVVDKVSALIILQSYLDYRQLSNDQQ